MTKFDFFKLMNNNVKGNTGYEPFDKQRLFHESEVKFPGLVTGTGFGKTAVGACELAYDAWTHPKATYIMFAPTYKMLKNVDMPEFEKWMPKRLYNKVGEQYNLINGGKIICLSGDVERNIDRIRGLTLGGGWLDEIRLCPGYLWMVIMSRLRDPNGSMRMCITTTSFGFDWVWKHWADKDIGNPQDYELFTGSSFDNPYTPQSYKDTLKATYTGKFAEQELYGKFVGFEGLVYSNFDKDKHVGNFADKRFIKMVAGVDWGYENPSVFLLCGIDGDDKIYVLDEIYERNLLVEELIDVGKKLMAKYVDPKKYVPLSISYCDPSRPEYIEKFNMAEIPAIGGNNQVIPGINAVQTKLKIKGDGKPSLYIDQKCINVIKEMQRYRFKETADGKPKPENPEKGNDHAMDALRYVVMSLHIEKGSLEDEFGSGSQW